MTIEQIRYFLALAQRLNFRAVAEMFFITQPTLSRQIAGMEEEVGAKLFLRSSSRVELTEAGRVMYEGMSQVCGRYDQVVRRVRETAAQNSGSLTLALQDDQLVSPQVLESVRRFARAYPDISVSLLRASPRELRQGLMELSYDVGNAMYLDGVYLRSLVFITLSEDPACLAVRRDIAERYPPVLSPAMVEDVVRRVPLCLAADEYFAVSVEPAAQLRENMRIDIADEDLHFEGHPSSMPLRISAGLCASILNSSHVLSTDPDISMVPIEGAAPYPKGLVYNSASTNPALTRFLDIFQQVRAMG